MKRWHCVLVLSTLLCACVVEAGETRDIEKVIPLEAGQTIRIEIPVAELRVEATDRSDIGIDLTVGCRWRLSDCKDAIEDLEIASRSTSRRMTLELAGFRSWPGSLMEVDGTIEIPRSSALEVKMGVADLEIRGIERDLRVDLGVGELDLRLARASFGEAFVDVGIGTVRFFGASEPRDDRRSFLVGNEVHWADGTGQAELDIEVGVGEVKIHLE